MSSDGLIFIAKDGTSTSHITSNPQASSPASPSISWTYSSPRIVSASSSTGAINLFIQDIPTGDDYYLLFLNSTHGVMYGASQRFSISDTGNGTAPTPAAGAPTVTISGGPNPTVGFATTFPPNPNGVSALKTVGGAQMQLMSLVSVVAVCALGGAWTVL